MLTSSGGAYLEMRGLYSFKYEQIISIILAAIYHVLLCSWSFAELQW